jgi:hypothetical protein
MRKQFMGQGVYIPLGNGIAQQQFQHLVRRKTVQAFLQETVADPLPVTLVYHGSLLVNSGALA